MILAGVGRFVSLFSPQALPLNSLGSEGDMDDRNSVKAGGGTGSPAMSPSNTLEFYGFGVQSKKGQKVPLKTLDYNPKVESRRTVSSSSSSSPSREYTDEDGDEYNNDIINSAVNYTGTGSDAVKAKRSNSYGTAMEVARKARHSHELIDTDSSSDDRSEDWIWEKKKIKVHVADDSVPCRIHTGKRFAAIPQKKQQSPRRHFGYGSDTLMDERKPPAKPVVPQPAKPITIDLMESDDDSLHDASFKTKPSPKKVVIDLVSSQDDNADCIPVPPPRLVCTTESRKPATKKARESKACSTNTASIPVHRKRAPSQNTDDQTSSPAKKNSRRMETEELKVCSKNESIPIHRKRSPSQITDDHTSSPAEKGNPRSMDWTAPAAPHQLGQQPLSVRTSLESSTSTSLNTSMDFPELAPLVLELSQYSRKDFDTMWIRAEDNVGCTTIEMETSNGIRAANRSVSAKDSEGQSSAQYGRILLEASEKLLVKILEVNRQEDVLVDIGSGIGNIVLQASYVHRCEARGIEVDEFRYHVSEIFRTDMEHQRRIHKERDDKDYQVGTTTFRHGSLDDPAHRKFLVQPSAGKSRIKAFFNNFNGVFNHKSAKLGQLYMLDDYVAALFAQMPPGSVLVSLYQLGMPATRCDANRQREKHGLVPSSNDSFYKMQTIQLGKHKEVLSWGGAEHVIKVYKYTRLQQAPCVVDGAVFRCCNRNCPDAMQGTDISAVKTIRLDGQERLILNRCQCLIETKPQRSRRTSTGKYKDANSDDEF